jgi:hypothetical protein
MRRLTLPLRLFLLAIALVLLGWLVQQGWQGVSTAKPATPQVSSRTEAIDGGHGLLESIPPDRNSTELKSVGSAHPTVELAVQPDRLWADLEALAAVRATAGDRQQARAYITQSLTAAGWSVQRQAFPGGINLYADHPGTDPQAGMVILGAHYDSVARSPGADDNATGVAAVLEVARLFAPISTRRTLRLVLFDLEETGLEGSTAFVAEDALVDGLYGAVILEMLGYACEEPGCQRYPDRLPIAPPTDRGNFLAALGDRPHADLLGAFQPLAGSESPAVISLAVPTGGGILPDFIRSDHAPFWRKGLGAVLLTDTAEFRTPHYHQPTDTPATITRSFFLQSTQIGVEGLLRLLES